jgi:predicted transcriptional regulator
MQKCATQINQLEIILNILDTCQKPQDQKKLKQKINVDFNDLKNCLNQLEDLSLVEVHPQKLQYQTSLKGQRFFEKCIQLQNILTPKEKLSIELPTKS